MENNRQASNTESSSPSSSAVEDAVQICDEYIARFRASAKRLERTKDGDDYHAMADGVERVKIAIISRHGLGEKTNETLHDVGMSMAAWLKLNPNATAANACTELMTRIEAALATPPLQTDDYRRGVEASITCLRSRFCSPHREGDCVICDAREQDINQLAALIPPEEGNNGNKQS